MTSAVAGAAGAAGAAAGAAVGTHTYDTCYHNHVIPSPIKIPGIQ